MASFEERVVTTSPDGEEQIEIVVCEYCPVCEQYQEVILGSNPPVYVIGSDCGH